MTENNPEPTIEFTFEDFAKGIIHAAIVVLLCLCVVLALMRPRIELYGDGVTIMRMNSASCVHPEISSASCSKPNALSEMD